MTTATMPDDALAARIADGDEVAFSILYQRYRVRIERYCRSIVRHDEDALDAAQNTLVKALIAIRAGRQAPTVVPWLFHIARNEAITVLRGRRPQSELGEWLPDLRRGPAAEAIAREELRATIDSVRALSDRSREALILREVAGMGYDELAAALGVTPGAARQAVHEARRSLLAERTGRDEECAVIRVALAERDGRRRNTRVVRAHLRGCDACRAWRADETAGAGRRLAALPGASAAGGLSSWLAGLLGSSASGGVAIGVNAKVLASLAVLAVGVAPSTERELPAPIAVPKPRPAAHVAAIHTAVAGKAVARVVPPVRRRLVPVAAAPLPVRRSVTPIRRMRRHAPVEPRVTFAHRRRDGAGQPPQPLQVRRPEVAHLRAETRPLTRARRNRGR